MHGALRSLIIPCVLGVTALGGASSLRVQAQESEAAAPPALVQEQPAPLAPEQAQEQGKQQGKEQQATHSEGAPDHTASPPLEPGQEQASQATTPEQAPAQPSQPNEQQTVRAAPEESAHEPEPAAKVDLSAYAPGTIVVETSERKLHLVLGQGEVLTYPVGVGKRGKSWAGTGAISGKYLRPAWSPPRALKREKPWTPDYIPGGSRSNPMGAAAMTLSVDQYAIHGTNDESSIGGFVSFGCIRMHNRDIIDLYKRVHVGTRVVVLR